MESTHHAQASTAMAPVPETMTLTKALVELKLLTKRIEKKIETTQFVAIKHGSSFPAAIQSQPEFEKDTKAAWQSINDLMARRRKIKTAVVVANATTNIEVAGEKLTIAEAIERKSLVNTEKKLVHQIRHALAEAQIQIDGHNHLVEERIAKLLESSYGNREAHLSKEDYEKIARPFKEGSVASLVDPLNCPKLVEKLEERLSVFQAEVDVSLSIANATTNITIR